MPLLPEVPIELPPSLIREVSANLTRECLPQSVQLVEPIRNRLAVPAERKVLGIVDRCIHLVILVLVQRVVLIPVEAVLLVQHLRLLLFHRLSELALQMPESVLKRIGKWTAHENLDPVLHTRQRLPHVPGEDVRSACFRCLSVCTRAGGQTMTHLPVLRASIRLPRQQGSASAICTLRLDLRRNLFPGLSLCGEQPLCALWKRASTFQALRLQSLFQTIHPQRHELPGGVVGGEIKLSRLRSVRPMRIVLVSVPTRHVSPLPHRVEVFHRLRQQRLQVHQRLGPVKKVAEVLMQVAHIAAILCFLVLLVDLIKLPENVQVVSIVGGPAGGIVRIVEAPEVEKARVEAREVQVLSIHFLPREADPFLRLRQEGQERCLLLRQLRRFRVQLRKLGVVFLRRFQLAVEGAHHAPIRFHALLLREEGTVAVLVDGERRCGRLAHGVGKVPDIVLLPHPLLHSPGLGVQCAHDAAFVALQ
mmetsp:Transcript_9773/g.36768  ORF Transcript_9773/g.36768 Transcript_9773/m.36768 type:complete len:476 (+) Transcript_9773:514-1941(+)